MVFLDEEAPPCTQGDVASTTKIPIGYTRDRRNDSMTAGLKALVKTSGLTNGNL